MKYTGAAGEYLHLQALDSAECYILKDVIPSSLTVLWFEADENQLVIDGVEHTFQKNEVIFLTEFHKVSVRHVKAMRFARFNKAFYCILDHDAEVSCKGLLFYGASQLPVIQLKEAELDKFETLWKMFLLEMDSEDSLQIDMLQMMLKRYLILCTRLYKSQHDFPAKVESDLLREFNFLVEHHFKTKHSVADYATMLNKSPKTISNVFAKKGAKTPLQLIQERKMLEARRLLGYSEQSIKEIAYALGFNDIQTFSRFFKKQEGISPSQFKENMAEGNMANS